MKRMIVNADDFGFSEAVNHGILKAMQEGIVTSTSIMANMPGFAHAIQLYHKHPDMAVGVHLNLTCYRPLLSTHQTLVTETGYFHKQDDVAGYSESEMYEELKAQIDCVLAHGIRIDHLDSHHHIHTTQKLQKVMEKLNKEYALPFRGGVAYPVSFPHAQLCMDFYDSGVSLSALEAVCANISDHEVTYLMCHPAYIDQFLYETTSYSWKRMKELEILCSEEAAALLQRYQIQLCTYKEV